MKQLIMFVVVLATAVVSAQNPAGSDIAAKMSASENVFLHANATAFVPGETLLYKLYCQTSYPGGLTSKVGYVELVSIDRKIIFTSKLFFSNGAADGDFFISPSLATGNYKLIGYTNAILDNPLKIFQIDIKIINPFQVSGKLSTNSAERVPVPETSLVGSEYNLLGASKSFAKRQQISLNLQSVLQQFPNSNLSLSVRKNDNLGTTERLSAAEYSKLNSTVAPTSTNTLPEWRGEIIEGTVSGANARKIPVALSIPGKTFEYKVANTDANGNFTFNIDKVHSRPDVYLQVIGADRDKYTVTTKARRQPAYGQLQINDYFPSPQEADAIQERSIAAQIQNAYYTRNADTLASSEPNSLFYESVEKKFVLSDYTRFPTFAQTIIEVIEGAYYEQNDGKYLLYVRDNNLGRPIPAPTLVLVDGLMLQDNADLFAYKASGIDHISTFSGVYLYGPTAFNGIISVVTKTQDFVTTEKSIVKADILRPSAKKKYFRQTHDNSIEDQKIPDYRYQLLWLPNIESSAVSFYSSDVGGNFELVIEGFSAKGEPISIRESFSVQ
ncbi:MAG TPA: hypothetical protein VFQ50_05195 [Flavobacterium sp.]|nr:hypothetical protein [Flavobacterium sp.]